MAASGIRMTSCIPCNVRFRIKQASRVANRTHRENTVADSHGGGFDELYAYDDLHRLIDMDRGDLNAGKDGISAGTLAYVEQWALDALGNWSSFDRDDDGDGTWDLEQARTHNDVNEITGVTETTGPAWADPAHDAAGNMTEAPKPGDETTKNKYVYDAWNRMVELQDSAGTTLWTYEYDGRGRRIVKTDKTGSPDVTWDAYFTNDWQKIERRKDSDADPYQQFVWGETYIDDLVVTFRDADTDGAVDDTTYALTDANFNATALISENGAALERYAYAAFSYSSILDADFSEDADGSSDKSNDVLFAGYSFDVESGLYLARHRTLQPLFGRWTQCDPLAYVDGPNLYQYCSCRPTVCTDPLGLRCYCSRKGFPRNPIHGTPCYRPGAWRLVQHMGRCRGYYTNWWGKRCPCPNDICSFLVLYECSPASDPYPEYPFLTWQVLFSSPSICEPGFKGWPIW